MQQVKHAKKGPPAARLAQGGGQPVWEDLVHDFLEVAGRLRLKERVFLIHRLRDAGILHERIDAHPSFSISGRLVVVRSGSFQRECWFYDPARRKIRIARIS